MAVDEPAAKPASSDEILGARANAHSVAGARPESGPETARVVRLQLLPVTQCLRAWPSRYSISMKGWPSCSSMSGHGEGTHLAYSPQAVGTRQSLRSCSEKLIQEGKPSRRGPQRKEAIRGWNRGLLPPSPLACLLTLRAMSCRPLMEGTGIALPWRPVPPGVSSATRTTSGRLVDDQSASRTRDLCVVSYVRDWITSRSGIIHLVDKRPRRGGALHMRE